MLIHCTHIMRSNSGTRGSDASVWPTYLYSPPVSICPVDDAVKPCRSALEFQICRLRRDCASSITAVAFQQVAVVTLLATTDDAITTHGCGRCCAVPSLFPSHAFQAIDGCGSPGFLGLGGGLSGPELRMRRRGQEGQGEADDRKCPQPGPAYH